MAYFFNSGGGDYYFLPPSNPEPKVPSIDEVYNQAHAEYLEQQAQRQAAIEAANQAAPQQTQVNNSREGNNFLQNAWADVGDMFEGATYLMVHPTEATAGLIAGEGEKLYDQMKSGWENPNVNQLTGTDPNLLTKAYGAISQPIGQLAEDAIDFMISNYDITTQDIFNALNGTGDKKEVVSRALKAAGEHPVFTGLDIVSLIFPALKAGRLGKGSKAVANMSTAQRVADQLNVSGAKANTNANKFVDKVDSIKKSHKYEDIKKAVEAHIGGYDAPDVNKQLLKDVGNVLDNYDNMLAQENKYAETLSKEDKFAVADSQRAKYNETKNGVDRSFDEIKRERQPYYDLMKNEGVEALEDLAKGREVELPYKEAESKPLPEMTDNYSKDLSHYTNTLFRETDATSADNLLNRKSMSSSDNLYFSNTKDMALGQGSNKGIMLEFDPKGIEGQVNLSKPGSELAYSKNQAEFIVHFGDKKTYMNNIKSVTITDANQLKAKNGQRLINMFEDEPEKWLKTVDENGNTKYINRKYAKKEFVSGNAIAQDILASKKQFDKGYLRIVPMAEITDIDKSGLINREGRTFAGKASDRMYGTATVDQIVDTYFTHPEEWMNRKVGNIIEKEVMGEIGTKGTLGGKPLVTESTKNIVYIDPTSKSIKTLAEGATKEATAANTLAIDKKLLGELKGQMSLMQTGTNPFAEGSFFSDMFNLVKGSVLGGGSYLAGNLETALYNAFMNVGMNPAKLASDFIDAWRSNGALAKRANSFRRLSPVSSNIKNPILKGFNKWTGGEAVSNGLNYLDTKIQNTAAEMAAHRKMKDLGIKYEKRAEMLENADAKTLADFADNIQTVSLMNKTKTILPGMKTLGKAWALTNPFWRWTDTALQSTLYMMQRSPMASNILWNKYMGQVLFDKEEQNRANLGVKSDNPFVSYRYNPYTKTLQEVSAEFMPVMNSVKIIGEAAQAYKEKDGQKFLQATGLFGIPFIGAIQGSIMGKDKYGRPLINAKMKDPMKMYADYRTGSRYVMTPNGFKETNMGDAGEILGTMLREASSSLNFLNKGLLPAAATAGSLLTGKDYTYYQPYQYTPFGEFQRAGVAPETDLANPRRMSNPLQTIDYVLGRYARDYDPRYEERPELMPKLNETKRIMRGISNYQNKTNQMILNRGGNY